MESAVHLRPESRDEFEIAIICALPVERNAIEALLEVDYEADGFSYKKAEGDPNTYTTGRLGNQHVVLAYMPGMGMVPAAAVTSNLRSSFKNIKVGIVVGVCGGATKTTAGEEILLGDVIISTSVIQIDFGRQYPHRFIKKKETEDTLGRAGPELRAFIGKMSGYLMSSRLKAKTNSYSSELCSRKEFLKSAYPGPEKDRLHQADLSHKHWTKGICSICDQCSKSGDEVCEDALTASCTELGCDGNKLVHRGRIQQAMEMGVPEDWTSITEIKEARKACIHFGRMACSSQVVKTGQERDRIASEEGVIGFEMESAGTWDYIPTIVIKSVCDYADSHKDKRWQAHASITAAACTKAVLEEWRSVDRPVQNLVNQEASVVDPTSAPNPVHWTVTRPANTLFVGRDDILCELENLVCSAIKRPSYHDQCWIVISGIGGQGKSEICLQLANRVRQSFWGIFWIDVSTETLAQSGFLDIASQLRMHARTWENARQSLANQKEPWLLVLDNADNPDVDYQQYFPSNTSGVVILTSRNSDCQQYATAKWIKLEGLPDVKACELLLQAARVPRESHITLEHDASIVVNLLRSHPLAIIQAGSYVSRGHCALKDYPKIFNKQRKRLLAFRPSQAQSRYRDVYTTFEASIEMLQSSDTESAKDALDLLPILALCGPNRLPISLLFESVWNAVQKFKTDSEDNDLYALTQWHVSRLPQLLRAKSTSWDSFRLIEAIHLLGTFSLVSIDSHKGYLTISMHPLIHAWARDRLTEEQEHENWIAAGCLFAFSRIYSNHSILWRNHEKQFQHHLQRIISWKTCEMFTTEPQAMICRILLNCGWQLQIMGDDTNVMMLLNELCSYLGLDLPAAIVDQQWLGIYELAAHNLQSRGKLSAAISLMDQVVKIKEQSMAASDPSRLGSVLHLAVLCRISGRHEKAISLLEQVVLIQQQSRQEYELDRISTQYELGLAYEANGQIKKGISLLEQALKESLLIEGHLHHLPIQRGLAGMYLGNGQAKEAVSLLEQVIKIEERFLAGDHPDRLASLHLLARAYYTDAQIENALSLLETVDDIRKQTEESLTADDISRFMFQLSIAMIYWHLGRRIESIQIMQHAVELGRRALDEDHPYLAISESWLRFFQSESSAPRRVYVIRMKK